MSLCIVTSEKFARHLTHKQCCVLLSEKSYFLCVCIRIEVSAIYISSIFIHFIALSARSIIIHARFAIIRVGAAFEPTINYTVLLWGRFHGEASIFT